MSKPSEVNGTGVSQERWEDSVFASHMAQHPTFWNHLTNTEKFALFTERIKEAY